MAQNQYALILQKMEEDAKAEALTVEAKKGSKAIPRPVAGYGVSSPGDKAFMENALIIYKAFHGKETTYAKLATDKNDRQEGIFKEFVGDVFRRYAQLVKASTAVNGKT